MYMLPAIDILDGRVVRLAQGDYEQVTVYNESPIEQARIFVDAGASWIHIVDLDGAKSGKSDNIGIIESIARKFSINIEIGGGVRSIDMLDRLAQAGASRVVIGTALVRDPEFAYAAVSRYGDLLAAGIDAKNSEAAVEGWREGAGVCAEELVRQVASMGYAHLVYTDIERDGMQTGIDADMYEHMASVFGHPVIASGGVADIADINRLACVGTSIEGVIVGRAIYEGTMPLEEAIALCAKSEGAAL